MVCHHRGPCNCDEEQIVEWWTLIITTCVTVALVLINTDPKGPSTAIFGQIPWTTIFTAYFFAVFWLMMFALVKSRTCQGRGPDANRKPPLFDTVFMMAFFSLFAGMLTPRPWPIPGTGNWREDDLPCMVCAALTFCIMILTRFFIEIYEEVRPDVIEKLLSQEKKKRQRERRGGW